MAHVTTYFIHCKHFKLYYRSWGKNVKCDDNAKASAAPAAASASVYSGGCFSCLCVVQRNFFRAIIENETFAHRIRPNNYEQKANEIFENGR